MSLIDWLIVAVPTLAIGALAVVMQRYVRSVADFMSASRVAGRYLITNAGAEMGLTIVGAVAWFEMVQESGFTLQWWNKLTIPVGLIMTLWGFVIYRYRETRVMTLAQFYEIRYSKSFRIFAGLVAFVSGTINYGIFPALAGRFFIYCCGLPEQVNLLGVPVPTLALVMAAYLTVTLTLTMTGGHLTIMVTDCVGSLITVVFYTIIVLVLLYIFSWSQIYEAMSTAPAGKSLLDPFDTGQAQDFNIWYVLIGIFGSIYGYMTWQGGHAFNNCALNAHEARMASILGNWRGFGSRLMFVLLPICAFTFMHHADFATGAAKAQATLQSIGDETIRTQVTTAVALGELLPTGVKGMLVAVFVLGLIACDSSYLHSWGSIFIQDCVLPFRKTPPSPRHHLRQLRIAIFLVAAFGFTFSLLYRQTQFVLMFFAITGAIYSGAGSVLLGGLYWRKGTTAGAWCAMVAGSTLAVIGLVVQDERVWAWLHGVVQAWAGADGWLAGLAGDWPAKFPINGQWMYLFSMVAAVSLYVVVSLLTAREDFNMERMLHRGQYAMAADREEAPAPALPSARSRLAGFIGIDANFTRGDRILAWSVASWSMFWFVLFVVITGWNLISRWPLAWWATYWRYEMIILPLLVMLVTTVWFWLGGVRDLVKLFHRLQTIKQNPKDDGMVMGHRNLDEVDTEPAAGT